MFFLCSLTSVNKGLVFTAFERGIPRLKEFSVCVSHGRLNACVNSFQASLL